MEGFPRCSRFLFHFLKFIALKFPYRRKQRAGAKVSQSILLQQNLVRTLSHASSPCSVHNFMACVRNVFKLPTQRKQLFPLGRLSPHYFCAEHVHTSSDKLNKIHSTQKCRAKFRANASQRTWPIGRSTGRILSAVDDSTVCRTARDETTAIPFLPSRSSIRSHVQ